MINAWETWACAAHFVSRYGTDAPLRAAARSDELLAASDLAGAQAFASIVRRINELVAKPSSTLH
ncbi:hypothetical protein E3U23_02690 [Erythrobacter litoralis]|uniref:hypothetical protein n=1 Tax=Erythrobacter litoralis TaxID=39960 RepID=UPI002435000C|nr:hypothetical protein [Erythrobacter litoralis]MDG6078101.1 hypothetical protein [Erythrobacter litoralis]